MNGNEDDDDDEIESDSAPLAVDEFLALPNLHPKKLSLWRHMHHCDDDDDVDFL